MNKTQANFPAAHSMDTTWYAMDKNGKLGWFESGEDGAVPTRFGQTEELEEPSDSLLSLFRKLRTDFYVDDLVAQESEYQIFENTSGQYEGVSFREYDAHRCLVWFKMEIPRKDRKSFVAIPHSKYCLGWAAKLPSAKIDKWIQTGELERIWIGLEPISHRSGFYLFENHQYGRFPYQLSGRPVKPLEISQLPKVWQAHFRTVAFNDIDFQLTRAIQPIEHMKCETWGNTWIDMDGNVRQGGKNIYGN